MTQYFFLKSNIFSAFLGVPQQLLRTTLRSPERKTWQERLMSPRSPAAQKSRFDSDQAAGQTPSDSSWLSFLAHSLQTVGQAPLSEEQTQAQSMFRGYKWEKGESFPSSLLPLPLESGVQVRATQIPLARTSVFVNSFKQERRKAKVRFLPSFKLLGRFRAYWVRVGNAGRKRAPS